MRSLSVNQQNHTMTVVGIFCRCLSLIACLFIFISRACCQNTLAISCNAEAVKLIAEARDTVKSDTVDPRTSSANRDAHIDPANGTYTRAAISSGDSALQIGPSMGNMSGFAQYNLGGFSGLPGYRMFSDCGSGTSTLMSKTEIRRRLIPKTDNKIAEALATHIKGAVFADVGKMNTYSDLMSRSMPAKGPLPTGLKIFKGYVIYSGGFDHIPNSVSE